PGDTPASSPWEGLDCEDTRGPCPSLEPPNEVQGAAVVVKEGKSLFRFQPGDYAGSANLPQYPDEFAALRIDESSGSGAPGSTLPSPVQLERHQEDTPLCPREGKPLYFYASETEDAAAVLRIKGLDCEEPDEFVTLRIDDNSCFEPLESLLSLQVQLEGPCKENPLRHLIEGKILCPFHPRRVTKAAVRRRVERIWASRGGTLLHIRTLFEGPNVLDVVPDVVLKVILEVVLDIVFNVF
ncbi:hypothetical protein HPB47_002754, partial [Ixodes persulcatus]